MDLIRDIRIKLSGGSGAVYRIIALNSVVFILTGIIHLLLFLTGSNLNGWTAAMTHFMLPASFSTLLAQPWSVITYLFLHENFFHILFNMLWLYWIGRLIEEYLGNRKAYEIYFAGGIFGGLVFMAAYHLFPAFDHSISTTYALGASAGVLAMVVAAATLLPEYGFQLLLFGTIRLKWLALITIALDLINIPNGNAGGHIAHLGGAAFGFIYIRYLYHRGKNIIPEKWTSVLLSRSKLKIHYKSEKEGNKGKTIPSQTEVDAVLDKISKSGYDSLTRREKEILFKASKD